MKIDLIFKILCIITTFTEACPRPPACPEDYPRQVLKGCPPLPPCGRPRRALDAQQPTESHTVAFVKTYSPISRPTIAWPITAGTTTTIKTTTTTTTTTTTIPPTISDPMKLLRIQRKATLKSQIFPDGNIFLLKQVAKNEPSPRPTLNKMQISNPNIPKHKVANVRAGKRVQRQEETTPCINETSIQNMFTEDDSEEEAETEHAFRPNEFHEHMITMEYHPQQDNKEEDSADKTETKPPKVPMAKAKTIKSPIPTSQATERATTRKITQAITQAAKTQSQTVSIPEQEYDITTSLTENMDYITFPPDYNENIPPVTQNCCPTCFCTIPMCMMGGCPSTYPVYAELDELFKKTASRHKINSPRNTKSTKFPRRRKYRRNRRQQIIYFGFANS